MSLHDRLSFATGYYTLDGEGIIHLSEDMPEDMRVKFWKEWIPFRKKIIEREKQYNFSSEYPFIPVEDKDPNEPQYKDLLKEE